MMKPAAGEAKKTTAPATSSGVPRRPSGVRADFLLAKSGVPPHPLPRQIGLHQARSDGIHGDAVRRELEGERPGQVHHGALRRAVRHALAPADDAVDRGEAHDPTAAAGPDHPGGSGLRDEYEAFEVDVDHGVPRVLVERRRDPAGCSCRRCSPGCQRFPTRGRCARSTRGWKPRCGLPGEARASASLLRAAQGHRLGIVAVPRCDSHVGAGVREGRGDRPSHPAGAAGDERSLSF